MPDRTRVLIPIGEPIGGQMSAVGIRQFEVGRALAAHCDVTFASPAAGNDTDHGIPIAPCQSRADFRALLRRHDVLYTLGLNADRFIDVAASGIRVILDMYTPLAFEIMECWPEVPATLMDRFHRRIVRWSLAQLSRADFVVCASDTQRDVWLGMLNAAGVLSVTQSRSDPAWHKLIDVVPQGLPDSPPRAAGQVLRRLLPALTPDDFVLLWSSNILAWQDPVTLIEAMARLRDSHPSIRLVFLGLGHPRPPHASILDNITLPTARTRAACEAFGLTDRSVFFVNDRIPYRDIGAYYLDANAAVATYPDSLETHMCLGSRLLDYLWAGLPMVVSGGEPQRSFVEGQGLGRAVAPGDAEALAEAILKLKHDVDVKAIDVSAFAAARERLRWSVVTKPIVEYCLNARPREGRRRGWPPIFPWLEFSLRSLACRLSSWWHGVR